LDSLGAEVLALGFVGSGRKGKKKRLYIENTHIM